MKGFGENLVKLRFCRSPLTIHLQCVHPHSLQAKILVFYSFFKTLVDQEVTVELKNDLSIKGILKSVDQFLNIKLDDITVLEEVKYPHLVNPPNTDVFGRTTMSCRSNDIDGRLRLRMFLFEGVL